MSESTVKCCKKWLVRSSTGYVCMVRKLAVLVLLILMMPGYAAETIRVGVVNPGYQERGFWGQVSEVMRAAAKQLNIELVEVYGQRHWKTMLNEGRELITQQSLDYLILVNEHQKAKDLMLLAEQMQLPTFMLLNDFDDSAPNQVYRTWKGSLIPDNHAAGLEMAMRLFSTRSAQTHLFTIVGDLRTPASLDRTSGLDSALQASPNVMELLRVSGEWSEEVAFLKTQLMLKRQTPDLIWAANDNIALGAIRALKQHNLVPGKDVSVVGLNWSPEGLKAVERGELLLTHGGHFMAGAWILVMIHDFHRLKAQFPVTRRSFAMSAIDASNVTTYQQCFGDNAWSRIDFLRYSQFPPNAVGDIQYSFNLGSMLEFARDCH